MITRIESGLRALVLTSLGLCPLQLWASDDVAPQTLSSGFGVAFTEHSAVIGNMTSQSGSDKQLHDYHGSAKLYKADIEAIENQYGVYDSQLVHQLTGLGLSQKAQGEHHDAIAAFKRAVHIKRINDGLHNLGQVPLLNHLVESYAATEDWTSANDKQFLLYRIQLRNYGKGNPRLLAPINKMVKWHLLAFQHGSSAIHLLRALELNRQAISIIENHFGDNDLRLGETLYRQAQASFHLAEVENASLQSPSVNSSMNKQRYNPATSSPDQMQVYFNPYRDGKKALLRRANLFKQNTDFPIDGQAEALVQLGDWYFLFDKKESAIRTYKEALELLSAGKETDTYRERLFDKPHALDFSIELDKQTKDPSEDSHKGYVDVSFTVTPGGRARNIKVVDSNPPDVMDSVVRRSIKFTRYRPRIIKGKPVLTKDFLQRQVFDF